MLEKSPNQKPQYGKRKTLQNPTVQEAKEMERFLNEGESSGVADGLELIKLIIILILKLINPFNWKTVYIASYSAWLKRNNKYEKLLDFWSARTPKNSSGKIIISLKLVDCYIQLGRYSEAMNCLKGLAEKVDDSDRDDEWKEEQHNQVKFYRKTIHNLATLSYRKDK